MTEHAEFLDQQDRLFAEAFITYFQYRPADDSNQASAQPPAGTPPAPGEATWQTDYTDIDPGTVEPGLALPELHIPITHKLIVSGAVATQDFIDVHHNAPAARAAHTFPGSSAATTWPSRACSP